MFDYGIFFHKITAARNFHIIFLGLVPLLLLQSCGLQKNVYKRMFISSLT